MGIPMRDVNVRTFKELINSEEGIILDVRTLDEYNTGYIEGSIHIDFFRPDFMDEIEKLDKNKPIYIYCRSGNRSGQAMFRMNAIGFKEVSNLAGGVIAWAQEGEELI